MSELLVDDDRALAQLLERLADSPWLAVDTEFVRERTYFGQLCVVQLGNATTAACIDALRVDLAPLWSFLADPARIKVLHSASQDIELFVHHAGSCPQPLFDTQIAAAMLGLGDQISYAALVELRLDVALDKSQTRTDWSARPLRPAQLSYAADDVRHLSALYPELRDAVDARGRTSWLEADCRALCQPERYRPDASQAWRRLRGLGKLTADQQHAAAALAHWREEHAIARNLPRRWVLPDEAVFSLAMARPDSADEAAGCADVPPKSAARHAPAWIACMASAPTGAAPLVEDFRPDGAHRALVKLLSATVREHAEALGVPPGLLAPRATLEQLARHGETDDNPTLQGWRREVIGEPLLSALRQASSQ